MLTGETVLGERSRPEAYKLFRASLQSDWLLPKWARYALCEFPISLTSFAWLKQYLQILSRNKFLPPSLSHTKRASNSKLSQMQTPPLSYSIHLILWFSDSLLTQRIRALTGLSGTRSWRASHTCCGQLLQVDPPSALWCSMDGPWLWMAMPLIIWYINMCYIMLYIYYIHVFIYILILILILGSTNIADFAPNSYPHWRWRCWRIFTEMNHGFFSFGENIFLEQSNNRTLRYFWSSPCYNAASSEGCLQLFIPLICVVFVINFEQCVVLHIRKRNRFICIRVGKTTGVAFFCALRFRNQSQLSS